MYIRKYTTHTHTHVLYTIHCTQYAHMKRKYLAIPTERKERQNTKNINKCQCISIKTLRLIVFVSLNFVLFFISCCYLMVQIAHDI